MKNLAFKHLDIKKNTFKIIIFNVLIEKQTYRSEQCFAHRKNSKNYGETLKAALQWMDGYLFDYQFFSGTRQNKFFYRAEKYTKGISLNRERKIERICEP